MRPSIEKKEEVLVILKIVLKVKKKVQEKIIVQTRLL